MGSAIAASGKRRFTKDRNSNVEFLRLLGMACIVLNHFPWDYDSLSSSCFSGGYPQFLVNLLSNFGGFGDCLFFGISAWWTGQGFLDGKKLLRSTSRSRSHGAL